MSTKTKISLAVLFAVFTAWFYYTPYLAFRGMKSAAEARDAAKLADYVNFPSLKESLKASFNAKLAATMVEKKDNNPFNALGAALAVAFIGPMIDAFVTPENLALMMKGEKPQLRKADEQQTPAESGTDTTMSYESFDRFVVTVKKKDASTEPIGLVFNRDGMFSWKLSAMRLPL